MATSHKRISVTQATLPPFDEYIEEIKPLWESHWITNMGEKHHEFELMLKEYLNAENISLYTNGHSALEGILEALQLGADGKKNVITTPYTFASTTHAIVRKGLNPVFADINETTFTIDPSSIEELITDDTCAILPVHVYGNPCDVESIQQIADKHGLKVIYDAAHAFGVKWKGESIIRFGDASILSFHATKVFNSIEGGAVCFADTDLEKPLNQWKNFGITGPESVEYIGGNAKLNEFSAAMGICNLRHIEESIAKRKKIFEAYFENLNEVPGIRVFKFPQDAKPNYSYMPILLDEEYVLTRNELFSILAENSILTRKYFFPLVTDYACYKDKFSSSNTPVAKKVADNILTLPMYPDLPLDEVDRICKLIKNPRS